MSHPVSLGYLIRVYMYMLRILTDAMTKTVKNIYIFATC